MLGIDGTTAEVRVMEKLIRRYPVVARGIISDINKECPTCQGGLTSLSERCPDCKGTGTIEEKGGV